MQCFEGPAEKKELLKKIMEKGEDTDVQHFPLYLHCPAWVAQW